MSQKDSLFLPTWLKINRNTSLTTYPQLVAFILQALAYNLPSDPQVGLDALQQDSRQWRVVWQCFLLVLTTPCLETENN